MDNYKVLLVDDDEQIRSGVASFIKKSNLRLTLVAEAENGADGLDIAEMLRPDIVLTDIKMPYMDGLEFCKKLRNILPAAKLVIFSGFDKFEYAQKAIEMSVFRYILKPINSEELKEVLLEVRGEIEQERAAQRDKAVLRRIYEQSLPVLRETLFVRLLDGRISAAEAQNYANSYGISLDEKYWSVCLIKSKCKENEQLTLTSIRSFLEKHVEFFGHTFYIAQYTDSLAMLMGVNNSDDISALINELTRICNLSKSYLENPIICGVGRAYKNIEYVAVSAEEAQSALCYRMLSDQNIVYIADVEPKADKLIAFDEAAEKELTAQIKTGCTENIKVTVDALSQKLNGASQDIMQSRLFFIEMITCLLRFIRKYDIALAQVFGEDFNGFVELTDFSSVDTAMEWFYNCCLKVQKLIITQSKDNKQFKINEAKEFIAKNYSDTTLDVDTLCDHLHLSPAYFSTLFKKHTDMSFTAYVTDVRMQAAVQLLQSTDEKTYAIAEKVGYIDPNYFSYVFKKKFGVSPSKYRAVI